MKFGLFITNYKLVFFLTHILDKNMVKGSNKLINDFNDLNVSGFTLKFRDKSIEKQFSEEYFHKSLFTFRVSFVITLVLYAAFSLLDYYTAYDFYVEFFVVRFVVVIPLSLGVLLFSYHRNFYKVWQKLISLSYLLGGLGIVYMLHKNPDNIFYYGGMFLIFIAGYFFLKLYFKSAVIVGVLIIILYNLSALFYASFNLHHLEYLLVTNAFYISANLMAMFALYNSEFLERKGFYQRFLLSEKQKEIVEINKNLESQVEERTELLNSRNQKLVVEINHRKKIEEMLFLAKEKAEESDRLKSAFLSNMSHEIRTPMNGILGFIELLKTPDLSKDEQNEYFKVVTDSSERLMFTINDIIEISKIEANQTPLNIATESIDEILNHQLAFFTPEAEMRGLKLNVNSTVSDIGVKTDRLKLESILTNLIKNALKFTKKGEIELGCELNKNKLSFYVKDTGIGIPQNRTEGIFNRFEQADLGIDRGYEGSGLGLSISKAYCEMLGGKMWVDSELDVGSTFYFEIDYTPVKLASETIQPEVVEQESINKEMSILLVEDDEMSASLVHAMLVHEKCNLLRVKNGREAVENCKTKTDFDLILMDIKMPVLDGIEATKQIRQFNKNIPIVALTAYALTGDKEKALDAGCSDYLTKPIKRKDLIGKIKELVD